MVFDKEKESTSTFNMSVATLQRIDNILQGMTTYNIQGNAVYLQRYLMQLYNELRPFLNEAEKKEGDAFFYKIKTCTRGSDPQHFMIAAGSWDLFQNSEWWMREKLKDKKLLMAVSDSPDSAISQM